MLTIVGIITFISMKYTQYESSNVKKSTFSQNLSLCEHLEISCSFKLSMIFFTTLAPAQSLVCSVVIDFFM